MLLYGASPAASTLGPPGGSRSARSEFAGLLLMQCKPEYQEEREDGTPARKWCKERRKI